MTEENESSIENQLKLTFPVFYLARKTDYQSQEILGVTDGPFISVEEAVREGRQKYKWNVTEYAVVEREETFKVAKMNIGN